MKARELRISGNSIGLYTYVRNIATRTDFNYELDIPFLATTPPTLAYRSYRCFAAISRLVDNYFYFQKPAARKSRIPGTQQRGE